jgi:hypothetical protein
LFKINFNLNCLFKINNNSKSKIFISNFYEGKKYNKIKQFSFYIEKNKYIIHINGRN